MAARFVNDFSTTLAAALASGATTCTVTTGVPAALVGSRTACRIGTEIVGVTFTTATVWALVRESEDADRYPQRAWPAGTAVDPVLTEALLAELAGQSVAAGAATGNTLWVDPLGDDATGTPERADKPYLTITAAKAAAPAGATVVVRPGTYDEYRIEADGVILWFEPGARVINTNGILLSEPIFNFGAGTYRVYGHGRFSGGNYDAILAGAGSDWLVECEEVTSDITVIDHSGGTGVVRGARVAGGAALTPWLFHLAGSLRFERCRVEPAAGAAATTLAGAELTFRDCVATTLDVPSGEPVAVEGTLTVGAAPSATTTGGPVVRSDTSAAAFGGPVTAPAFVGVDLLNPLSAAEVAVTGATTATVGRMHVCSGTTADYTATLPAAAGNAGKLIGFRMAAGLTKLVTLDGSGAELIDGAQTRVMWAGESAILLCDGSNWFKVAGKTRPMSAELRANVAQSIATNTDTKLTLPNVTFSYGTMADAATSRLYARRPGPVQVAAFIRVESGATMAVNAIVYRNGAEVYRNAAYSTGGNPPHVNATPVVDAAAGDYFELYLYQNAGSSQSTSGITSPDLRARLSVTEVPQW